MADVFLAYSRSDSDAARLVVEHLGRSGLSVWSDVQNLPGGDFSQLISDEIANAKCLVVIWSEQSRRSSWVRKEAAHAAQLNIPILQIVLGSLDFNQIPLGFQHLHAMSFSTITPQALESIAANVEIALRTAVRTSVPQVVEETSVVGSSSVAANQPHVFISHVDTDKPRVRKFVERLLERGLAVFVDKPAEFGLDHKWIGSPLLDYIRYSENYRPAISRALSKSGCVLVFWSANSVKTDRQIFWDEVEFGSSGECLVSAMIDNVIAGPDKLPKGYGFSQANIANLVADDAIDNQFEWVIADIRRLLASYRTQLTLSAPVGEPM